MLKERSKLEDMLVKTMANNITKENKLSIRQKWCLELSEKYNVPIAMSSDIMAQRKDLSEYNEFILFAFTDILKPTKVSEYFTDKEIKLYSGQKLQLNSRKFPIELHMIKVTDDQYIGATSAQFLMKLREQQLINYNPDTQRALRIILKGGTKIARPYVDHTNVKEIRESYRDNTFIPNMITLNINLDDELANYHYDDRTETFTVSDLTAFDMVDGYHRYLGMGGNYDMDNSWDYPMMLQITTFSVGKAKQFIWQEDHKTKMKITDAVTYDQYNPGNMVVSRLNTDPSCYMNGKININDGLIDAGVMSSVINRLWFPTKPDRKEVIMTSKDIQFRLNSFTEDIIEYMDKKWDTYEIIMVLYGFKNDHTSGEINAALRLLTEDNKKTLNKIKDVNNKALNIIKEVY